MKFFQKTSNSFLRKIEQQFHQAQAYVCENTLENARRVIPRKTLLQRTIKKLRTIQKASKKGRTFIGSQIFLFNI